MLKIVIVTLANQRVICDTVCYHNLCIVSAAHWSILKAVPLVKLSVNLLFLLGLTNATLQSARGFSICLWGQYYLCIAALNIHIHSTDH